MTAKCEDLMSLHSRGNHGNTERISSQARFCTLRRSGSGFRNAHVVGE